MSGLFDRWMATVRSTESSHSAEQTEANASQPALFAVEPGRASEPEAEPAAPEAEPAAALEAEPAAENAARARRGAPSVLDSVLVAAVDVARQALLEVAPEAEVGAHLGAIAEGTRLVTHSFACTAPAYRGWHWVAVLARAPRSKKATVCETALLPGDAAVIAPAWVPWENRVRPGDLGPKDVLPHADDDPNLDLGLEQVDAEPDEDIDQVPNFEFGLGRVRVLSREGISRAASRWERSDSGPQGEYAKRADAQCSTCGYLLPIAGSVRTRFGVCANAWSPFDGRVVALDAGCGAHSETDVEARSTTPSEPVLDELNEPLDTMDTAATAAEAATSGAAAEDKAATASHAQD